MSPWFDPDMHIFALAEKIENKYCADSLIIVKKTMDQAVIGNDSLSVHVFMANTLYLLP